jgi:hypothetical protein
VVDAVPSDAADLSAGKKLRGGSCAQDITPQTLPVSMNGGYTDRLVTLVHDRLHARCLVLDDGTTKLVIVVCDNCALSRNVVDAAKQTASRSTGIPPENMLISATHTHSAPTAAALFQSDPDPEYLTFLREQIAKGIEKAVANLEPCRVGWAVGVNPTHVFNRRWKMKPGTAPPNPFGDATEKVMMNPGRDNPNRVEPAGTIDPAVSILAVVARDGRPISLLANYSLHFVGGFPGLSADYFGVFAERMKQLLGAENVQPAFVGIMSNGSSGDVNNINLAEPGRGRRTDGEQIEFVADSVARTAYDACKGIAYHDWVPLAAHVREIELGVRRPSPEDVAQARNILAKSKGPGVTDLTEVYARETVKLAEYPSTVKANLQAMRIGELGLVGLPCETFVETGLEIKKRSPRKPTFIIELANGYNGYLPTPEQHALGGYETWRAQSSYLETGASRKIVDTLLELLAEVSK